MSLCTGKCSLLPKTKGKRQPIPVLYVRYPIFRSFRLYPSLISHMPTFPVRPLGHSMPAIHLPSQTHPKPIPLPPQLPLPAIPSISPVLASKSRTNHPKPVHIHAKCPLNAKKHAQTFCQNPKTPYLCTRFPKGRQSQRQNEIFERLRT